MSRPSGRSNFGLALALLALAASTRLLLQIAAMPPYAGLDEAYHAARIAFVAAEGRDPVSLEPSIPPYLKRTLDGDPAAPPDFASVGERWPEWVRSGTVPLVDRPLAPEDLRPYTIANYEAQQPSLYYRLAAPLANAAPPRSALGELRAFRLLSIAFAALAVVLAGALGYRFFGSAAILAAALLASAPTWLTLVARAANDALACAAIAAGLAVTLTRADRRGDGREPAGWIAAEAVAWTVATAAKLYSWPLLALLPLAWRRQGASPARIATVALTVSGAVALVVGDFVARTSNPLGLFAFDPIRSAPGVSAAVATDWVGMAKIWAATAVWTSGQHWNALTRGAMAAFAIPIALLALFGLRELWRRQRPLAATLLVALALFAAAQAINAAGYLRSARLAGASLPAGGKEAWYWYAMAPLLALPLAAAFRSRRAGALLAVVATIWIVGWDLRIAEGGLFRDWAGQTAPGRPSAFFRWGPLPDDPTLPPTGVGPLAGWEVELRLAHLAAMAAIAALVWRSRREALAGPEPPVSSGAYPTSKGW